jgi:hypothetical protein
MKITAITAIISGAISGGCLSAIQIRRVIKGEMPMFGGLDAFKAESKIRVDKFDKNAFDRWCIFRLFSYFYNAVLQMKTRTYKQMNKNKKKRITPQSRRLALSGARFYSSQLRQRLTVFVSRRIK